MTTSSKPHRPAFIDVLREWNAGPLRFAQQNETLLPDQTRRAVEELVRRLGDRVAKPPAPHELEETLRTIRTAWETTRSLDGVPIRDLRRAPWVFFYPRAPAESWIVREEPFLGVWLRWLDESRNARATTALMREFLVVYPESLPIFEVLRLELRKQLKRAKSPRLTRWRERSDQFGLLDKGGPPRLIERWWTGDGTVEDFFDAAGLSGLEAGAFVEKATDQLLKQTEKRLRSDEATVTDLKRPLEWLEAGGRLRFESLRVATAQALLGPFIKRVPKPPVQERIRGFLCRTIGDPRMRRPAWQGVPDDVRDVLFRWLVKISFEDFFRVFDDTAWRRHWIYRKAFWSAYLNKQSISEAWVVLGPDAMERVKRSSPAEGVAAASLRTGTGATREHSVLLMRIGGLTIAEWSHNGTCRIWRQGGECPRSC